MDPVTLALLGGGLLIFGAMVYFFLKAQDAAENAEKYKNETARMNTVLERNTRELENLKKELRQRQAKEVTSEASSQRATDPQAVYTQDPELRNIQQTIDQLISEMDEERPKWKEELGISDAILGISGTYNIPSAFTLIKLILRSIVLLSHLTDPQGAISDIRGRTSRLEDRVQAVMDRVDAWKEEQEKAKPAQSSSSVNVTVHTGNRMGSNYNISGGNQGAVGDRSQASDFVQVSQTNQKGSLAEAASEIQALLRQLEESNPHASEVEKMLISTTKRLHGLRDA